jgi:integrase
VLAAADAARDAHERLRRNAAGDYTPDPKADRFPPLAMPKDPLTIDALWAAYKKSKKPSPGTVKRWDPVITKMREFTKCTDVHALTENDLLRWRDHLLETGGIQPKTVKETYIAAVRAVLGWGKTERKLKANDAADVNVTLPNSDKQKVRSKGFTDEEASTILSATLAPFSDLMTPEHAAARRWVPWICAYTGARVNEITQLRAEDVIRCVFPSGVPGYAAGTAFWALNITPEAGTVKTGTYRVVPLHDHLIEQGFVAFAMAKGQGPLFYAPERQKKGASGQNPTYARVGQALGEWVRGLGVDDPNVAPNHGWRHRFKTIGRQVGMDSAKLDAIQGHVQSNEGGEYGEFPAAALKPEIDKMPSYDVTAALTVDRRTRGAARAARR